MSHAQAASAVAATTTTVGTQPECCACGAGELVEAFRVGGGAGEQGLIPTTDAYGTALDDLVRCTACRHVQLASPPAESDLLSLYAGAESDAYVEEEAGQRATARGVLDLIERNLQTTGTPRILDLGCWVGFLLAEARDRGWEATGVEPSDFAFKYATEELGLDVIQADIFGAELPAHSFDVIVLGDVIEHLVNPKAALEYLAGLLAPGGVLFMALPDAGSLVARAMGRRWWSIIPTHVQQFTRRSMRALLGRTGYETIDIVTAPKSFTVRYYLWRIGGYSTTVSKALIRVAELLRLADRMWTPDFRDRMGVIARAPAR